jgi:hypothetical protein
MRRAKCFSFLAGVIFSWAFLAGPAAAQMCIDPPAGMLGWWPGDGDSIDLQSGLHSVAVNGAAYAPGLVGDAFDFNGVDQGRDDRVDLPASALDGLEDFTVEMWVQSQDDQGAWLSGSTNRGAGFDNEILLFQGVNGIQAGMRSEGTGVLPIFLNDGAWHHLAYTRSGTIGALYVDGASIDIRSVPAEPLEIALGGLMVGQEQDCVAGCLDPEQALDGLVDELTVYDRALSEEEIVAIFDAREAGKCKPPSKADLLQQIGDLEAQIDELYEQIDELEEEVGERDAQIDGLEAQVAELEADVDTLLDRIGELEAAAGETVPPEEEVLPHHCTKGHHCKHCRGHRRLKQLYRHVR